MTAQMAVAEVVTRTLTRSEIQSKGDTPKLGRCSLNLEAFREMSGVIRPAMQYFRKLQMEHQPAWLKVGGAKKLARRLIVDSEAGLRGTFLATYEHSGRDVAKMCFSESSIGSDFALIEEKLAAAMPVQENTNPDVAAIGSSQASLQAASGGVSVPADGAPGENPDLRDKEEAAAAAAKRAAEDAAAAATSKKTAEDAAAAEAQRRKAEAEERKHQAEEAEAQAVRNETRIAMDDVMTIFDNVPRAGCPAPDAITSAAWVAFMIPVQSYIRGRPGRTMPILQAKHLQELQWITSKDVLVVGCGHDPSVVQAVQAKLKQFEAVKAFQWQPLVPVAQARSRTKHYVEYVLVGLGVDCPCSGSVPGFLQAKRGYPTHSLRPKQCEQPVPGINARACEHQEQVCTVHTWARARYLAHLPNPPRVFRKESDANGDDDFLGLLDDGEAKKGEESSDSEGSIASLALKSDQESGDEGGAAPPSALQKGKEWYDAWRWGWAPDTWKIFLQHLNPPLVVLSGSVHAQPGFLMAVLSYNEERYGLDRCAMLAFYPRNGAVEEEGIKPKHKALEQAHMADHVLAQVSSAYADFRLAASKAVKKRHLFRVSSQEVTPPAKFPKKDTAEQATPGEGAGTDGIVAAGSMPGAGSAAGGSAVKATQFIGVYGNYGPKGSLIALPIEVSTEDSENEDAGGDAGNMSHAVVSKRNMSAMAKHKVKIRKSTGPEGSGNGLFTDADLAAGTSIPVKGIWFKDLEKLNLWLNEQHPLTAQAMCKKIVEVNFSAPPEGATVRQYLVMTGVAGYINAYGNIAQRPNTQLVLNADRPLGQHSLQLRLIGEIAADRELVIAYGAKHSMKDKKRSGPKPKKLKKTE